MSRLLEDKFDPDADGPVGAKALLVRGIRFTHSAAKFWSSLFDEVIQDYPECDTLILETLTDAKLTRDVLFPEEQLQRMLKRVDQLADIQQALREAMDEFELYGAPDAVRIRLLANHTERKACALPLDCVDADILPYLVVWLLEWAELPSELWSEPEMHGAFSANDLARRLRYDVRFDLDRHHASEGLYAWQLTMSVQRTEVDAMSPPR